MRKILDRVTITGADDSVAPEKLVEISHEFPFVEWGILLSPSQECVSRFPSQLWREAFYKVADDSIRISGHLCGRWGCEILVGQSGFLGECWTEVCSFDRFQINTHAKPHEWAVSPLLELLKTYSSKQFIFQADGVHVALFACVAQLSSNVASMFDLSHGAGVLPSEWPRPKQEGYYGYAGGLSPQNVGPQLESIAEVCGKGPIWVDTETHVRSAERFDLHKVVDFLSACRPFVI